jgi:hypothetical protein
MFGLSANDPVDITGMTITAQARIKASDPAIAATAIITITDPLKGEFTVEWDGEELRTLLAGAETWVGLWDLQMERAGELPRTVVRGAFTVTEDVTRA